MSAWHQTLSTRAACPLCGSVEYDPLPASGRNLYSEQLAVVLGAAELELLEYLQNLACTGCGLHYKRRWFAPAQLHALFNHSVATHPKGWDVISGRFSAQSFASELASLSLAAAANDRLSMARYQRALISVLDSMPRLEGSQLLRDCLAAIARTDVPFLQQVSQQLAAHFDQPYPFKRFSGFAASELWTWWEAKLGVIRSYAEVGCPLWGQLRRADGTCQKTYLRREEANYWGQSCVQQGRSCVAALSDCTSVSAGDWDQPGAQRFDLLGAFQYLDHLEDPLGFVTEALARSRALCLILDAAHAPVAIQHYTGWSARPIAWLAQHFNLRWCDDFAPIRASGNVAYLLHP